MPYEILSILGKGAFGVVYRFRHSNNQEYALKVVTLTDSTNLETALTEGQMMMNFSHPHIVQCVFFTQIEMSKVCMVLEYCGRGTLTKEIQRAPTEEPRAVNWFTQMADAIKYLHEEHVMHRDLKPDNILLTTSDHIKVGDLGIAREQEYTAQSAGTQIGTPCYMSPQIIRGNRYTNKTDIWSLGCVFHQVLSRQPPFSFHNLPAILNGPTPALPGDYSTRLKNYIFSILERNESVRPTAQDIFTFCKSLIPGGYQRIQYRRLERIRLDRQEVINALRNYNAVNVGGGSSAEADANNCSI